jgi:hypothetical protein
MNSPVSKIVNMLTETLPRPQGRYAAYSPPNAYASSGTNATAAPAGAEGNTPASNEAPWINPMIHATDYAAMLPKQAADRFHSLVEIKDDGYAVYSALSPDLDEARIEVQKQHRRVEHIFSELKRDRRYMHGEVGGDDLAADPLVTKERERLNKLKNTLARIQKRRDASLAKSGPVGRILSGIEKYLDGVRSGGLSLAPEVTINRGVSIDGIIKEIQSFRSDLGEIEVAPWPAADAKARAIAEIDYLASRGAISVGNSVDHRSQLRWPNEKTHLVGFGSKDEHGRPDVWGKTTLSADVALLAWLHRDALVERVCAEIDAVSDDAIALSEEDRRSRTEKTQAQIMHAERVCAAIIWKTDAHDRWPEEIDPRAVLGIVGPVSKEYLA